MNPSLIQKETENSLLVARNFVVQVEERSKLAAPEDQALLASTLLTWGAVFVSIGLLATAPSQAAQSSNEEEDDLTATGNLR